MDVSDIRTKTIENWKLYLSGEITLTEMTIRNEKLTEIGQKEETLKDLETDTINKVKSVFGEVKVVETKEDEETRWNY